MAIPEGYRQNFEMMLEAAKNADLALVECTDKHTGKPVITICAIGRDGDEFVITPFAKMFDGNQYEELNPP
jgi:hypothetical protein